MDRTKAIENLVRIRHMHDQRVFGAINDEEDEALGMAIEALVDKDTNVPTKWIPVSERMPEHGGYYLVTKKISEECWFVGLAHYRSTCERWFGDHEVTAWMPLPEPWKGE